jgi:hypothetical protein
MITMVERPGYSPETEAGHNMESLIAEMGRRLQSRYIEGAIPYLRKHEPELWKKLDALDRILTVEALTAYELLFFEGLRRYLTYLNRKAA